MVDNMFTWVTFFKEVHEKIHNNYNAKQLANIANKIFGHIKDIDDYGNEVSIQEMTPINFIGYFNRRLTLNKRIQYCQKLKEIMDLTSETPIDFDGIPEFNNQNCLCMPFKKDRADYIVREQWEISKQILNDNINTELFDKILSDAHPYIRLSYLSRFCFIVKPEKYYPYDKQMAINLNAKMPETYKGYNDYCKLLKYTYSEKTSYELSYEAFMENNNKQYKKQTEEKSNNLPLNIPLNQILYGPPGTGKTFQTKKIIKNIIYKNILEKTKITLKSVDANTPWWQAIALAIYKNDKNKKYKVPEIENLIKDYIKLKKNNTVRNKIWEQLQKHTDYSSETVFAKDRNEPFIFDKTKGSEWYLSSRGISYIEDQLINTIVIEQKDNEKDKYFDFITFHQSYSYEEFIEGIKPLTKSGQVEYNIVNGIFKNMCIKANSDPNNNYVLVIDEINRGNISKIFGELITLIEEDKRIIPNGSNNIDDANLKINKNSISVNSIVTNLPYSQKKFGVPKNLYILGTMNTSDRSIASIDIALRRRFKFKEIIPDSSLVADFGIGFNKIFDNLNNKIKLLLDRDHQIGHSYFINTKYNNSNGNNNTETLKDIWFSEILPLLNEYFYCDWEKLKLIVPGFIKKLNVPEVLKNECDDSIYEFKTCDEVEDFETALKQEKFEQV